MEIRMANELDIEGWMSLVRKVKDHFPGLETQAALKEHRDTVLDFMRKESAICARMDGRIIGALLFSKAPATLCFLAVDAEYRRQHIAREMVNHMLSLLDANQDVVVTTYREGDPEGVAVRAFYKHLGFEEGRLTEEFGSPVQEFILYRSTRSASR